jgi:indolepyruvate ferredoxin oxidoreductase alpha subunit
MKYLLSGNEALALGAYHAGVRVATAYPGTPSTEILESLTQYKDIYAEWSTNEKVAMEVAMGASYAGVRAMVSMKHVGLNVASDPFMAAATTGVIGGLVVISADDPGMHSSQNEQDNRYYARLAKIPLLEPTDSQDAYELIIQAFEISEQFDTPVMLRTTTRISHAKSVVTTERNRADNFQPPQFKNNGLKFIMLPANARRRHQLALVKLQELTRYSETFTFNDIKWGNLELGVISSGIAYQYAREVFPMASFIKLGMSYPLPEGLIRQLAQKVQQLIVVEELEPFMEEQIKAMGIDVQGKEALPRTGELNPEIVRNSAIGAGWIEGDYAEPPPLDQQFSDLPSRPPLLCPGCPHTGLFFVMSSLGIRRQNEEPNTGLVITGDIGCYTLAAYPPLSAMDTCACMGAGIGQAQGMQQAGIAQKIVAVIGDSTFIHSGINSLINAVYNQSNIIVVILDNGTTAMTGHQPHPGSGITAQGKQSQALDIENLVRSTGVKALQVVPAFELKALRKAVKNALEILGLSVIIVRGACAISSRRYSPALKVNNEKCDSCGTCLKLGCPAIKKDARQIVIDTKQCIGDSCTLCQQVCPNQAINAPTNEVING